MMLPQHMLTLAWMPGPLEWSIIALLGLLIFGRRLPEVGASLGKSIVEFKRGIRGVKDEIDQEVSRDRAEQENRVLPDQQPPGYTVSRSDTVEKSNEGPATSS